MPFSCCPQLWHMTSHCLQIKTTCWTPAAAGPPTTQLRHLGVGSPKWHRKPVNMSNICQKLTAYYVITMLYSISLTAGFWSITSSSWAGWPIQSSTTQWIITIIMKLDKSKQGSQWTYTNNVWTAVAPVSMDAFTPCIKQHRSSGSSNQPVSTQCFTIGPSEDHNLPDSGLGHLQSWWLLIIFHNVGIAIMHHPPNHHFYGWDSNHQKLGWQSKSGIAT